MSDSRFKIVFDGALRPGVDSTTARLNLAELFKSDVEAIEKLFTGRPVALKRDLSQAEADTYLLALNNAGVEAQIEAEQPVAFSLHEAHEAKNSTPDEFSSPYAPPRAAVGEHVAQFSAPRIFTYQGRIGRLRFLARSVLLTMAMFATSLLLFSPQLNLLGFSPETQIFSALGTIAMLVVVVWVSTQICVQRLHDLGWSGWLWFLYLVPLVGSIFALLLVILPGNAGSNRYGPPPAPNGIGIKVLALLGTLLLTLILLGALVGGMAGFVKEYRHSMDSSYETSSITSDDGDEVEAQSAEDTAEPVDSAQQ